MAHIRWRVSPRSFTVADGKRFSEAALTVNAHECRRLARPVGTWTTTDVSVRGTTVPQWLEFSVAIAFSTLVALWIVAFTRPE
jgi:hypothetical protein